MKFSAALLLCLFFLPGVGNAGVFNLATFTCDSYENQILNHPPVESSEDAVNYAMCCSATPWGARETIRSIAWPADLWHCPG